MARFATGCDPSTDDLVEAPNIMRALEPEVVDAVWQPSKALLPTRPLDEHPLGCLRSFRACRC